MKGGGDRLRLAALLCGEVSVVVLLDAIGSVADFSIEWSQPVAWLEQSPLEQAVGGIALTGAQVLAHWVLASTVMYAAATLSRRPSIVRAIGSATAPIIRRFVGRALAMSLSAGLAAPATATAQESSPLPPIVVAVDDQGRFQPPGYLVERPPIPAPSAVAPRPGLPGSSGDSAAAGHDVAEPSATPAQPDAAATAAADQGAVHVVQPGEHLWMISEMRLEELTGRAAIGDHEVAPYWVQVIEANRHSIRSGDPDLIYPGEEILLPPLASGVSDGGG